MSESIRVKLLGARGSLPVSGRAFTKYGGATSCLLTDIGGDAIILDAGTGILTCPELTAQKGISILISHTHIDHILGFPMCPFLYDRSYDVDVYLSTRDGLDARSQISALMSPPLWPAGIESVEAKLAFHDISDSFLIGRTRVETMESNHPGGSTIFKLTAADKSLVYATDFEHSEYHSEKLADFAHNCGVLIYDSQFRDSEYNEKKGWGHSTYEEGIKMGMRCNAEFTIFYHHDPQRTDSQLDEIEKLIACAKTPCIIGRCGEEFIV